MIDPNARDATDYGKDIAGSTYVGSLYGVAKGVTNVANALVRRLMDDAGCLSPDDDGYGGGLRSYCGARFTAAGREALRALMKSQCEADLRVAHCDSTLVQKANVLEGHLQVELRTGETFAMVMGISDVTAKVLSVNGVAVAPAVTAPTSTAVVYVQGPAGPIGPPGTSGGGGGGGGTGGNLIDEASAFADASGTEVLVSNQVPFDFGIVGGTVTARLVCVVGSTSGTATFRLRIGGTVGNADGTVATTVTASAAGPLKLSNSGTFANPGGVQLVTITMQSSGLGSTANIKGRSASIQ